MRGEVRRPRRRLGGGGRRAGLEWIFEFFFQNLETSGLDIPCPQDARSESWYLEKLGLGGSSLGQVGGAALGFVPTPIFTLSDHLFFGLFLPGTRLGRLKQV